MASLTREEERAYNLLLQHLSPEQVKTFKEQGYFEFKSKRDRLWRLYTAESLYARKASYYPTGILMEWPKTVSKILPPGSVHGFNVWATAMTYGRPKLPECDTLLALKAFVEATGETPTGCGASEHFETLNKELPAGTLTKYN